MGYALGLGMLMNFPWEGMRFGDDLFWGGVFGMLLRTLLLFGVLLVACLYVSILNVLSSLPY